MSRLALKDMVGAVAWSPDERFLVTASGTDRELKLVRHLLHWQDLIKEACLG